MVRTQSVTVVIPTIGRYCLLKESLQSIIAQSYLPDEIIVVDNGVSARNYDEFLCSFEKNINIKFLWQAKGSVSEARNRGIKIAKSELVVFTDDDCIFNKDWIENLIQPFLENQNVGIVGGEIITEFCLNNFTENYLVATKMSHVGIESDISWKRGYPAGLISLGTGFAIHPFFTAANMAVRSNVFREIGSFDTDFKTNEDLEFCIRARKCGWKLFFEPKAVVIHKPPRTLMGILRGWYDYGIFHGPLFRKYNSKITEVYIYKSWAKGSFPNFWHFIFKTPFNAVIFLNSFHIMNIALISAVIFKVMNVNILFTMFILLFLFFLFRYLWLRRGDKHGPNIFIYLIISYLLNLSYSMGAFIGGLKNGMFYLEATVDEAR